MKNKWIQTIMGVWYLVVLFMNYYSDMSDRKVMVFGIAYIIAYMFILDFLKRGE